MSMTEKQLRKKEANKKYREKLKEARETGPTQETEPPSQPEETVTIRKEDYEYMLDFIRRYEDNQENHEEDQKSQQEDAFSDSEDEEEARKRQRKIAKKGKEKRGENDFFFHLMKQAKISLATSAGTLLPTIGLYLGQKLFMSYQRQQATPPQASRVPPTGPSQQQTVFFERYA